MHPDTSTARELYDPTSRGDYSPQSVLYRPDLYANFVEFYLHNNIASEVDALRSAASDEDGDITNAELVHELGACFNALTAVLHVTASVKAGLGPALQGPAQGAGRGAVERGRSFPPRRGARLRFRWQR
mmetsp:Transcript_24223/g.62443  ORF Transcript_24223/g.62443 Transcript_24223/m.62443 type:complete len:129 (-) Transcript_24223:400-786(-)